MPPNAALGPCAKCDKPAQIHCADCADGVNMNGVPTKTVYCDSACREADHEKHAKSCAIKNNRKELYRAGELLQSTFYIWREVAFDMKVEQVEKKKRNKSGKNVLVLRQGKYSDDPNEGPLYPLPVLAHLDEKDKQSILSYSACSDAMCYFVNLSQKLLSGITKDIKENYTKVSESDYCVSRTDYLGRPDSAPVGHQFLTLQTPLDGKRYVLDPAGAQFGQFRAVCSPSQRTQWMIHGIEKIAEHGQSESNTAGTRNGNNDHNMHPAIDFRVYHVDEAMRKILEQAIKEWEEQQDQTLAELLGKDHEVYAAGKTSFLDFVRMALQKFVNDYNSGVVTVPKHRRPGSRQTRPDVDEKDIVGTPAFFANLAAKGVEIFHV